jgi:hypothetical protein
LFVLTCHWTVGAGSPDADEENATFGAPYVTVWDTGCAVTVGAEQTASVPVVIAESPEAVLLVAVTVNELEPVGVLVDVRIVRVALFDVSPCVKVTELGENVPLAPVASEDTKRLALKFPELFPRVTVTL